MATTNMTRRRRVHVARHRPDISHRVGVGGKEKKWRRRKKHKIGEKEALRRRRLNKVKSSQKTKTK